MKGKKMEDIKTETKDLNLRGIAPGFIGFSIKARDTESNQAVHDAFREFCKVETDKNYTLGIAKLLEYYQGDYKYEMIHDALKEVRVLIDDLRESVVAVSAKPEEKESTLFGE